MVKVSYNEAVTHLLRTFGTVSKETVSQYGRLFYDENARNGNWKDKLVRGHIPEREMVTVADIPCLTLKHYCEPTIAQVNAFDAFFVLSGAEPDPFVSGTPSVTRGYFPYDYVYLGAKNVCGIINYDMYGKRKIQAHNMITGQNPERLMHSVKLAIAASGGYIEELKEIPEVYSGGYLIRLNRKIVKNEADIMSVTDREVEILEAHHD